MPYSTNAELPDSIKNSVKAEAGRDIMREVVNSQLKAGKSETVAFAFAWAALQRAGYSQNDEGEWIDKTLTLGDVHVPSTEERGILAKVVDKLKVVLKIDVDDIEEALEDQALIDEYVSKADDIEKAEYQGKDVDLNKPFRTPGESKKFAVYVRNDEGNVVIVRFGDSSMEIKRDDPEARANFRARHNCDAKKDKTAAGYWSCVMWSSASVSDILKSDRELRRKDDNTSHMPIDYDESALGKIRPDQMPRLLGAITHPDKNEEKEIGFEELTAIQNRIDTKRVRQIARRDDDLDKPSGIVARLNGKNYILDGHHRIIGRWLAGHEKVKVNFINLQPKSNAMKRDTDFNFTADILKSDEDQRLVYGWASIIYENGEPVTDSQGDIIAEDDLLEAAHNYVSQYREAKAMHEGSQIGEVVESLVFTADVQEALGIDLGKIGWFIGMKISDDAVWAKFRDGSLSEFSVGGRGRRIEIDD